MGPKRLTTDPALLKELRQSATKPHTANELLEQRVSFIYGSMSDKSDVTRDQIRRALREGAGTVG